MRLSKNTVKISFIVLGATLLLHPHFITGHVLNVPREYVQSLLSLLILILMYVLYRYYDEQGVRNDELEKDLNSTMRYVGVANRRMEVLSSMTSSLFDYYTPTKNGRRELFEYLLSIAVNSIAKTEWGILRFINIESGSTVAEYIFHTNNNVSMHNKIGNKVILGGCKKPKCICKVADGIIAVMSQESVSSTHAFLILPKQSGNKKRINVLVSVVNQAQLWFLRMKNEA